jgi:hypothetical protein
VLKIISLQLIKRVLVVSILGIILYSCSLLKIETAQEPLSRQELNMRLLTQSLVSEVTNRVEYAADSIISVTTNSQLQKHAYRWKIETLNTLKNTAFQSSPKLSLMDTWTYLLQVRNFMNTDEARDYFGNYVNYVAQISQKNVNDIENKARSFFKPDNFNRHQDFASQHALKNPISSANLKHNPVRSDYVEFLEVPDSLAFTTVGSLSEVMTNFSDKLTFSADAASKQFKWNTELLLKEKGFDSVQIKDIMRTIEMKVDRLSDIAENTPDKFNEALKSFSNDMQYLFYSLNKQIAFVSERMALERQAIDTIIKRERIALDSIILRERKAVVDQAGDISVRVAKEAMLHVKDLTGTFLFYIVLMFAVLLFLPFVLGYFTGKIHQKNKHHEKKN